MATKKSMIFCKKNCNEKQIDDYFGQKNDDFSEKVEFRLTIKKSKKKFRLRRHLSGHFLKKV